MGPEKVSDQLQLWGYNVEVGFLLVKAEALRRFRSRDQVKRIIFYFSGVVCHKSRSGLGG